ncbi:hypothetical protein EUGRSUZ_K01806 [Eucalyptus grandis]|uniref:Uncharacterized protein n=2 Tax=Eucalyptus grandis TaxID=71139 RepID=A0ACC3IUZ6_EUCGR|nr:hypothetical protein EUGRSUZ_K01806 [Eucalyptus grandis]
MAESLLFSIVEGVLWKIASRTLQEAVAIYGIENQISELRETLTAIKAVLLDAEEQQVKNHSLQVWLNRLRDVFYDAEDVLDELECEALRKQVLSRYGGIYGKSAENDVPHTRSQDMTYSFINKSDVFGRDLDRKKIIEFLQPTNDENLSVIPIVGIGGLGKTTVAKLVYNDDNAKEQFELRIWVCVPEDFDLKKTIEEIIEDATGQSSGNFNIQQLQTHLQNIIKDKKYLLVLDDVWSNDRRKWNELRALLSVGASESKIIVTTRSSEVASEKELCPKLLEIGNDIVGKSQGVPLLVKILGSLLYTKDEERYWKHIRDCKTWELVEAKKDILPALKLSYDHLPSHLKRCFSILSLYPRGHNIKSMNLADLWMAFGLISSTRNKLALEDVGVEYCNSLRYLDLPFGSFEELPSSIFNLKQLRMLSLQYNTRLKKLPNTICELQSLLYLSLISCSELGHLPKNMKRLISLRYLYIATKQKSLQESGIQYLENLLLLGLEGCNNLEVLFEGTCRLTRLQKLEILDCGRPIYLLQCLEGSACTLETFFFYDCLSFMVVPEWLPNHTRLKLIRLIRCPNLSSMQQGIRCLTALKELRIVHCGELSKRCEPQTGKDWHKIAHVPRIKVDRK